MFAAESAVALAVVVLLPGSPVRGTLSGGQTHTLRLDVQASQLANCAVDQAENDLKTTVRAPANRPPMVFDQRERGVDRVSFVAETAGVYVIELTSVAAAVRRARYIVSCEPFRAWTEQDAPLLEAAALATAAKELFTRGDRDSVRQAVERLTRARALWQRAGLTDMELAALTGSGDALYALSDFVIAEPIYREALAITRTLGDPRSEAEVLNNLGMVSWRLGEVSDALEILDAAIARWRGVGHRFGEAAALSNRGILLQETGEYDDARTHFAGALAIVRALGERRGEAFALNNRAAVLFELGREAAALRDIRRAVALFRETKERLAEGRALVWEARIQLALAHQREALLVAERGLALIRSSANRLAEADALRHLGHILEGSDRRSAREHYSQALELYEKIGSRRGRSDAMHDLAQNHLAEGDAAAAVPLLEQALAIRRTLGMRRLEADTLFRMAQAARGLGDLPGAEARLETALEIVEDLRGRVFEQQLRTSYLATKDSYYREYVDVLLDRHRREPDAGFAARAFDAAERRRARELNDRLRDAWTADTGGAAAALIEEERRIRREINYWSWQLWRQADRVDAREREQTLRGRIDTLLAKTSEIEARLRRAVPAYAASLRLEIIPVDALQKEVLADGATVLLHYMLDEPSRVFAVTSSAITVFELESRSVIERGARALHRLLAAAPTAASDRALRRETGQLGRRLLAPVAALIEGRRVLVVPDGALHYVPFAALVHPTQAKPLLELNEIATAPSATTLVLLRREAAARPRAPKTLAVFADPVFDNLDPRVSVHAKAPAATPADAPIPRRLARLPYSRQEADQIASFVPPAERFTALDFEANRTLAMSRALAGYRILHYATHGVEDDRQPSLAGIVLSLVNREGVPQDGFLRLHDLYALELGADLVVLSACSTGTGVVVGGEGVSSLARGFLHAGASRVVSTLWKVDDEATATMMRLFYQKMFSGTRMPPAAALRAAQLQLRQQTRWQQPYFWAAYVISGGW